MSSDVLLSGAARLLAKLWKAMRLPSLLIDGSSDELLPAMAALLKAINWPLKLTDGWSAPKRAVNRPAALTLTASVVLAAWPLLATRLRAKMSVVSLASPATRLEASLSKVTTRPSLLTSAVEEEAWLPAAVPAGLMLASTVVPA